MLIYFNFKLANKKITCKDSPANVFSMMTQAKAINTRSSWTALSQSNYAFLNTWHTRDSLNSQVISGWMKEEFLSVREYYKVLTDLDFDLVSPVLFGALGGKTSPLGSISCDRFGLISRALRSLWKLPRQFHLGCPCSHFSCGGIHWMVVFGWQIVFWRRTCPSLSQCCSEDGWLCFDGSLC